MADQVPRRSPPPPRTAGPETTAAARGSGPRPPAGSCESPGRLIYEHGPLHSPCLSRADASGWAAPSAGRPARPDCGGRVGLGPAAAGLGPPNGSGMLWLQVQVGPLLDPAQSRRAEIRRSTAAAPLRPPPSRPAGPGPGAAARPARAAGGFHYRGQQHLPERGHRPQAEYSRPAPPSRGRTCQARAVAMEGTVRVGRRRGGYSSGGPGVRPATRFQVKEDRIRRECE